MGDHLGGDIPDALIALEVEFVMAILKAGLSLGLKLDGPL